MFAKAADAYWRARIQALRPYDQNAVPPTDGHDIYPAGDKQNAFSSLKQAVDRRCFEIVWLQTDPRLDPLRSDPRYKDLLQRLNLAPR